MLTDVVVPLGVQTAFHHPSAVQNIFLGRGQARQRQARKSECLHLDTTRVRDVPERATSRGYQDSEREEVAMSVRIAMGHLKCFGSPGCGGWAEAAWHRR